MNQENGNQLIAFYCNLNRACKDLEVGALERASVPEGMPYSEIIVFLKNLQHGSEPYRVMKLVVLGHGQIGKTTLLRAINNILKKTEEVCGRQ